MWIVGVRIVEDGGLVVVVGGFRHVGAAEY